MAKEKKKFIQKAIKHPGALRAIAEREGGIGADGLIKITWLRDKAKNGSLHEKRMANLALTLRGF